MFGIGFTELILILVVALIFVGPEKLPEIARALGKAYSEIRRAGEDVKRSVAGIESAHTPVAGLRPPVAETKAGDHGVEEKTRTQRPAENKQGAARTAERTAGRKKRRARRRPPSGKATPS